ncbi:Uncharacterized protein SCF082_LOCUS35590 [Durusdinium trenchii]|uniref:Uncharacterized protein n=1 Tax=Durusdinium trenchii TaxID=1381693 RepID=A0ABP0P9L4_9DINO
MVQEPDVKETMDEIPSPSTVYYPEKRDQPGGEEKKSGGGLVEIPGPTNLGVDVTDVPDIADKTAPRFRKGQHHITPNAIRCRARRIFTPRANGTYKVSDDIYNEWHGKGQPRKNLEDIFRSCGYDPESFVCEVEVLRREMQSTEFHIEAEFLTTNEMIEKGLSEKLQSVEVRKRAKWQEQGVDQEESDQADSREGLASKRKSLGIPELDPDVLPSSVVQKYLTALAKRLAKMQLLFNKFDDADKLSDMQTRPLFCTSLVKR